MKPTYAVEIMLSCSVRRAIADGPENHLARNITSRISSLIVEHMSETRDVDSCKRLISTRGGVVECATDMICGWSHGCGSENPGSASTPFR